MTIRLPQDLERSIEAAVHHGRFASLDDAMERAARLLLRELDQQGPQLDPAASLHTTAHDPILGLMRDDAALMDEIMNDAYRHRRDDSWREFDF